MAKTFAVDDEVRDVLSQSTIDRQSVKLPGQLDRKLYEKVNKVLTSAGGKWSRKAGAHLFERDPREALGLAVQTGQAVNLQQQTQQFFTPPEVADLVIQLAKIEPHHTILEPSIGTGNLVYALDRLPLSKQRMSPTQGIQGVELDPLLARNLVRQGFKVYCGDFLECTPEQLGQFDRVIMNPPFENGADIKHIEHARRFLKFGGRLVSVCAAGSRQKEKLGTWIRRWIPLAPDSFKESGTWINTAIVMWQSYDDSDPQQAMAEVMGDD